MFPGCPEHCNVEGTLSEYSRNIACRLGRKRLSLGTKNEIRKYYFPHGNYQNFACAFQINDRIVWDVIKTEPP